MALSFIIIFYFQEIELLENPSFEAWGSSKNTYREIMATPDAKLPLKKGILQS
jgi:hypothetical protein